MARIMKYEFIKNRFRYLVMIAIMIIVEVAFLISNAVSYRISSGMSVILILAGLGTFLIVIFEGIAMYNRDLREKSGYMLFMTPLPSWQILLGKITVILIVGSALFIGYCFLGFADIHLIASAMKRDDPTSSLVPAIAKLLDSLYSGDTVITLIKLLICIICLVTYLLCLAYLASTISASVLRGKKGEKLISVVLFLALFILVVYISSKISNIANAVSLGMGTNGLELKLFENFNEAGASIIFELGCSAAAFAASAYLLEKKVDI